MEWTRTKMRKLISIEEWKIKEMIFKKLNEYTRLFEYKCTTTTIMLYKTKINIYMNIYIHIYIYGDQIYEQTCTLRMEEHWAGQNRTCVDFHEKYLTMNGYVSCVTSCFIQGERGRSYQGQTRRHHTEKIQTHLQGLE